MNDALMIFLWIGGVGWFFLTYLLKEGNGKGVLRNLLVTVFMWLITVDILSVMTGIAGSVFHAVQAKSGHPVGFPWGLVAGFVVLPYVLCGLRLRWLSRERHRIKRSVECEMGNLPGEPCADFPLSDARDPE